MDVLPSLPANQAVAFARMPRSTLLRTSRSRAWLARCGARLFAASRTTQVEMLCGLQLNSRPNSLGVLTCPEILGPLVTWKRLPD